MSALTFDGFGPFAEGLDNDERSRRLDRLAAAAGGTEAAPYIEMIRLTKEHPRNLLPVLDTLNSKLSAEAQEAVRAAYEAQA